MGKKEEEFTLGGHRAKITVANPAAQKKTDKLSSMRIALTYIESQNMKVSPEKAIKIADIFLAWLEK